MYIPNEIWLYIIKYLKSIDDIISFTATCSFLYRLRYDRYTVKIVRNIKLNEMLKKKINKIQKIKEKPFLLYFPHPKEPPFPKLVDTYPQNFKKVLNQIYNDSYNIVFVDTLVNHFDNVQKIYHFKEKRPLRENKYINRSADFLVSIKVPKNCKKKEIWFFNQYDYPLFKLPIIKCKCKLPCSLPLAILQCEPSIKVNIDDCIATYIYLDNSRRFNFLTTEIMFEKCKLFEDVGIEHGRLIRCDIKK